MENKYNIIYSLEPLVDKQVRFIEEKIPIHKVILLDRKTFFDDTEYHQKMEILICRDRDEVSKLLDICPRLKFIYIVSTGVERLPFKKLADRGIVVCNTGGVNSGIMAEYAMGAILAHSTRIWENLQNQQSHYWKKFQCVDSLSKKTLLIVGAGRTGQLLAKKAKAFDMQVIGVKRSLVHQLPNFDKMGTLEQMDAYLSIADYIVCSLPLTPETLYLFDKMKFSRMKSTVTFINISRGRLVVQEDLIQALYCGQIGSAVLDVFNEEPLSENDTIWDTPNLYITPHSSGRLENFMDKAILCFTINMKAYLMNSPLPNIVNLQYGY